LGLGPLVEREVEEFVILYDFDGNGDGIDRDRKTFL
jgi:hypothetical protein